MSALVEASGLVVTYAVAAGSVQALDGVDLSVEAGETLAIVGESGSGKTTLGMALGRLLPSDARRVQGELRVAGVSVFDTDATALRALRRRALGFVFQNPMAALDPTMRIGRQVARALDGRPDPARIAALLGRAGLPEPARVARSYPHELSGGMAQRVSIAMAIARNPALLVADEPTASLDASVRERVMQTLMTLRAETGASLIILSHDLRLVARHCERVAVMYGGRIVELGRREDVFARPAHPYTSALLAAAAGNEGPEGVLLAIPGNPPTLYKRAEQCAFAPRCRFCRERCRSERPERRQIGERDVLCHFAEEILADAAAAAMPVVSP
jgi:oligopeptide/dipeptide ABC transporter ATP-binding protein